MKLNAKITFVKIKYRNSTSNGQRKMYIVSNDSIGEEIENQIDKAVKNLPEYDDNFNYTIEATFELPEEVTNGINSICLVGD